VEEDLAGGGLPKGDSKRRINEGRSQSKAKRERKKRTVLDQQLSKAHYSNEAKTNEAETNETRNQQQTNLYRERRFSVTRDS
jgi:hypothetical protein